MILTFGLTKKSFKKGYFLTIVLKVIVGPSLNLCYCSTFCNLPLTELPLSALGGVGRLGLGWGRKQPKLVNW